ncbi:phosphatase PAP2 family protein [Flavobacterium cellulosilyticum]|uniref:Phosphatase PAP2 family protein n=1 Tax=Flavobacterium cellulosilyticum TaxID=2541731 RepID=A0A4R5C812_9FLAO|nr:phosphatase PAP2 family protein [Flavobacterium cellulosilyticum]TDD95961.1 phosphatase PAP2 family protein [Flavobacterium cellulosilyticum]
MFILFFLINGSLIAQSLDTIKTNDSLINIKLSNDFKFKPKQLIIPSVLIAYGFIGMESDWVKNINKEISEEVTENIDRRLTIDDFSQYAPALSVYALGAIGIKGKNNLKDKSIILATSFIIMSITVTALKSIAKIERPDGYSNNSFPSGHTANAFMGAEFLYQEYKVTSVWYGVSGYVVAAATGAFRIYNNRHWLTDVVSGAGIGIVSAKAGYWLLPVVNKLFTSSSNPNKRSAFIPYYNGNQVGFGYVSSF